MSNENTTPYITHLENLVKSLESDLLQAEIDLCVAEEKLEAAGAVLQRAEQETVFCLMILADLMEKHRVLRAQHLLLLVILGQLVD